MKKFFSHLVYALLPIFLVNLLLFGTLLFLSFHEDLRFVNYASSIDKEQRLKNLSDRIRLVIIGGSNARFSIHSELLKDSLGIEPVNMGIHVGLGLDYMFEEISDELKKGDILLVSAEYTHYLSKDNYLGGEGLTDMYLIRHQWEKAFRHIFSSRNFFSVYRLLARRIKRMNTRAEDIPLRMETRTKYNRYGDYTGHYTLPKRPFRVSPLYNDPDPEILTDIRGKIKQLQQKGVKVYIVPPPYCQTALEQDSVIIRRIGGKLRENGMPFVATPKRYTYPDSLFYDTQYHLTQKGGDLHTRNLIEDIRRVLLSGNK